MGVVDEGQGGLVKRRWRRDSRAFKFPSHGPSIGGEKAYAVVLNPRHAGTVRSCKRRSSPVILHTNQGRGDLELSTELVS